jgi:lysophospholipid acyltransferase (LPLAT)-like uncharacterized protein
VKPLLRALRSAAAAAAPTAGAWAVRALGATFRLRMEPRGLYGTPPGARPPAVIAFWHDQLLGLLASLWNRGDRYAVLVSRHADAEPIARAAARLGLAVVRGSSARGGAEAVAALAAARRRGCHVIVTPDGPKGPRHRASGGALVLARRWQCEIVPLGCAMRPRWRAGSWDRLQVPVPFARVAVVEGEPIAPGDGDRDRLERTLNALTARAEALVGR